MFDLQRGNTPLVPPGRRALAVAFVLVLVLVLALVPACTSGGGGGGGGKGKGGIGGGAGGGSTTPGSGSGSGQAQPATATAETPTGAAGDVDFFYTLAHPGGSPADIAVDYSVDGGRSYYPATAGPGGDGTTGLSTTASGGGGSGGGGSGVRHRYVWSSLTDCAATDQYEVRLRVTPIAPAAGTPSESAVFTVSNAALASPGAAVLLRYPYVQKVTQTSAVVHWRLDRAALGAVEYGTTPALGAVATSSGPATEHALDLAGLTPGAPCFYRVLGDGFRMTPIEQLKTANDASQQRFRFVVFGDSGNGGNSQRAVADLMRAAGPDFAIHVGDVIYPYGSDDDYTPKFFGPYRDLLRRAPIFPSLGNHDILAFLGDPYLQNFDLFTNNPDGSERYYSYTYGHSRFIAIDSSLGFIIPGSGQHTWLIDQLQNPANQTGSTWTFVYFHHAPYSSGQHGSNYLIRYLVSPIFEQAGVDVVFTGHDHNYERTDPVRDFVSGGPGVVYFVSGGGGASTRNVGSSGFTAYSEEVHHFLQVDIDGRTLTAQAIREDGTVADTWTYSK